MSHAPPNEAQRRPAPPDAAAALAVRIGQATSAGGRERNEDFFGCVTPEGSDCAIKGVLLALADGVSGGAGREASEGAVRSLLSDYYATPATWEAPRALDQVISAANTWMLTHGAANRQLAGLATTLSVLVLRGARYYVAHVGDTRIYRLRQGELTALTQDHVWDRPDMRHVLKRAVGLDRHLVLDFADGWLKEGDAFLLCSDGVWEPLGEARIRELLLQHEEPERAARALVDQARRRGGRDDATAGVVRVDRVAPHRWQDWLGAGVNLLPPPRLKAGQRIDEFEVLELVHESRATLLYRVRARSGQVLALKTLQPALAADRESCEGLLAEEWLAKRLVCGSFPQVIPLAPEARRHLYYVMSYHPGATLQQQLDRGKHFPVPEVVKIGIEIANGLGVLHRLSILHRDIKPANLLRGDDGGLRLLDMGVALAAGVPYPELQGNPGTPSFMAPELFRGEAPSPQSDIYAAGVTLYHLLTRKYPFGEIEPFQHPRFGDPLPPTRCRPDIPGWLENVLLRALTRDRGQRFETAEELLLALERGDRTPVSAPARTPWAQQHAAALWSGIAAVSLVVNLLIVYWLLVR